VAVSVAFSGIAVANLDRALDWYERLMGRPPDLRPHEGEAAWQLREGAWVYVVRDRDRAGHGLLTVIVDDLDRKLAEVSGREIAVDAIEELGGGVRKATVTDPEGNRISFGQVPAASG